MPDCYNKDKMPRLFSDQYAQWDEVHKKCTEGEDGGDENKTHVIRFPHDKNGKLDIKNGEYDESIPMHLKVKYPNEVCLASGMLCSHPY